MAQFQPISEEEAKLAGLLKPGAGDFTVAKAEDKHSQAGNQYLNLTIKAVDQDGREGMIFDICMYGGQMSWKLRHLMCAVGMQQAYEAGDIDPLDLVGRGGKLIIRHETDKRDDRIKNAVGDYVALAAEQGKVGYTPPQPRAEGMSLPRREPAPRVTADQALAPAGTFEDVDIPF